MGATAAPADDSEALGQIIRTELLGGDILDVSQAVSGNPSGVGPNVTPLNVTLLQGLTVDLGGGLQLPLISGPGGAGLLDLGELGALNAFAGSPTANASTASAGAITPDGAVATDINNPGAYGNAKVNLTDVLDQLGVAGITDQVVDNLGLELGAIASRATATGTAGSVDFASEYTVADLELNVSSPLVGTVATSLGGVLGGVGDTLDAAVGTGGVLDTVVGAVDLDLGIPAVLQVQVGGGTISIDGLDAAITAATNTLITEPLADPNGIVSIDLANGLVSVDLAKIVNGPGATDLNGLDPNTLVLDDTTITAITSAVSAALGTLTTKVTTVVTDLINNLQVHIALGASATILIPVADFTITVDAALGQLTGALPGSPVVGVEGDLAGIPLGNVLGLVTTPVINLLTTTLAPVINTLLGTVTTGLAPAIDGIVNPVVAALSPLFDALNEVVEITINEQEDPGVLGPESFTVNAISLELLPGLGALNLDLGSSTVRAAEVAAVDPTVDAQDPVQAGASLPVTGADWVPGSTVTLTLRDASNNTIGTPVPVTVAGDGTFPSGTVYGIPANTPVGTGYVLTAVDDQDPQNIATDTVSITAGGGDVNTNAAASASASADATANGDPAAQAAAVAAALADATATATAAATANANAAAQTAARADVDVDASADASTTSTSAANAQAAAAAQAAAQADNSSTATADSTASTAANANSSVSSQAAATSNASTQASSEASTNANAAASASASANADASNDVVAQAAAQASAYADATAVADAAATAAANSAARASATSTATASPAASADATSASNANAAVAAQAAALADASSDTEASGSITGDPNTDASTASEAAAIANASNTASADAVASANASATTTANASASTTATAEANTNASASAAASAQADNDNNAAAQAAAVAAALANATTQQDAAATANAEAAAAAAATAQAEASTNASTDATSETNARAAAAAQSSAEADSSQAATAQANANASAAASYAANADASVNASAEAAAAANASASATTSASASASANANPTGKLGITVKVPVLERGQQQTAVGTGFKPGEVVTGVMHSDPLALGTQVANAEGTVTFTWAIPAGTDLGTHSVTLTGAESGSVAGTFQVVAKGLATTGGTAPNGWIVLGALLLMFGLGTALVARSKRETVTAE